LNVMRSWKIYHIAPYNIMHVYSARQTKTQLTQDIMCACVACRHLEAGVLSRLCTRYAADGGTKRRWPPARTRAHFTTDSLRARGCRRAQATWDVGAVEGAVVDRPLAPGFWLSWGRVMYYVLQTVSCKV
jgi:hypothetical protein